MSRVGPQSESYFVGRIGWLRAAVLGANDGILSAASLIVDVATPPSPKIFSLQELLGSARCQWLRANTFP
jgi:VIT1/CCC1 family predicted Fe2+/Mn2+ transporter